METNLKTAGQSISLKTKKILLLGSGKQAENFLSIFLKKKIYVETLCGTKNSHLNLKRLKKRYKIKNIEFDIKKAFEKKDYNYVFVCINWNKIEKEIFKIIQLAKCPIYVEKPVALSKKNLIKIVNYKNKYKKKIYVMYNRRYYSTIGVIKKNILNNKKIRFHIDIPEQKNRLLKKYGPKMIGNVKYFISSHWLDLFFYLDEKIKIKQIISNKDITSIFLEGKKINGIINFYLNAIDRIKAVFYFNKFTLLLDPLEKLYKTSNLKKSKNAYKVSKTLIYNDLSNQFKPGMVEMISSIFSKNKIKMKLPEVSKLLPMYNLLEKIDF